MLELFAIAAHLVAAPEPDWAAKKRLLRQRLAAVVAEGNAEYERDDDLPRLAMERLPGRHGAFDHDWQVMRIDLESVHDARKFWHVWRETIPHEWAHHLNAALHAARGHDERFQSVFERLEGRDRQNGDGFDVRDARPR